MDYTVNRSPTAYVVLAAAGEVWTDPMYVLAGDGKCASVTVPAGSVSQRIRLSRFGFNSSLFATRPTGLRVSGFGHGDVEGVGPFLYAQLVPDGSALEGNVGASGMIPTTADKFSAGGAMAGWGVDLGAGPGPDFAVDVWIGNALEEQEVTVWLDAVWIELAFD